jgi:hypothetical protein
MSWEQTKRAAQMSFVAPDNNLTAAHESVNRFYQQILTRGEVSQTIGKETTTDKIIDGNFRDLAHQLDAYMDREKEQDMGIEPDR